MKNLVLRISMAAALAFTAVAARADAVTTLYSTGVNGSGGLLANGAQDSHYTLTAVPSGSGQGGLTPAACEVR